MLSVMVPPAKGSSLISRVLGFITPSRVILTISALVTFIVLNAVMYIQYGMPFLHHTFFHHLTRIDHRHNFSPYSTLLYLASAGGASYRFETLAFLPQLVLSVIAIPLVLAKRSLATAMLAQTFAFVTFNKVCTSQVCPKISHEVDLANIGTVFYMVPHSSSILPAFIFSHSEAHVGHCGRCVLGSRPGNVFPRTLYVAEVLY